jgi:predicted DNA-binding transcriptional regulator
VSELEGVLSEMKWNHCGWTCSELGYHAIKGGLKYTGSKDSNAYRILKTLVEEDSMTTSQLAKRLHIRKGHVDGEVAGLVEDGLLVRDWGWE